MTPPKIIVKIFLKEISHLKTHPEYVLAIIIQIFYKDPVDY
jgi:hypothetical protein